MKNNRFAPKIAADGQPDIVDQIIKEGKKREVEGDIKRINFNMPVYLHDLAQDKIRKKGYNLTTYLLTLVRKDLGEE
jgi:type III secretion system FlhB-like substrate exporter